VKHYGFVFYVERTAAKWLRTPYLPHSRELFRKDDLVEAVVQTDGTVGEVRVVRSLDKTHGMDEEAVRTVKQ
jgi:hypothetical protein